MYRSHLNLPLDYVFPGLLVCLFKRNNAGYFLAIYGGIAYHFSLKMSRLLLICGPIVAIVCAIWLGFVLDFIMEPFLLLLGKKYPAEDAVFSGSSNGETDSSAEQKVVGGKVQPPVKGKKVQPPPAKKN